MTKAEKKQLEAAQAEEAARERREKIAALSREMNEALAEERQHKDAKNEAERKARAAKSRAEAYQREIVKLSMQ